MADLYEDEIMKYLQSLQPAPEPTRTPVGKALSAFGKAFTQQPINMQDRGWESSLAAAIGGPLGAAIIGDVLAGPRTGRAVGTAAIEKGPQLFNTQEERYKQGAELQNAMAKAAITKKEGSASERIHQARIDEQTSSALGLIKLGQMIDPTTRGLKDLSHPRNENEMRALLEMYSKDSPGYSPKIPTIDAALKELYKPVEKQESFFQKFMRGLKESMTPVKVIPKPKVEQMLSPRERTILDSAMEQGISEEEALASIEELRKR